MDLNDCNRSLNGYLSELSCVPQALERLCRYCENDGEPLFKDVASQIRICSDIFIFGMASSQWASLPLALGLEHIGMNVHWMSAYDGLQIPLDRFRKSALVMFISQSGETIEVAKLLRRIKENQNRPLVIALTNSPTSFLACEADIVVDILAGSECHAPSKTYVNSVAAIFILYSFVIDRGSGESMRTINLLLNIVLSTASSQVYWKDWGKTVTKSWSEVWGPIQFLGMGPKMASAWQASLLCSETAREFSAVGDWATFRHGFEPQVTRLYTAIGFKTIQSESEVWVTTTRTFRDCGGQIFITPDLIDQTVHELCKRASFNYDMVSTVWETLPIHYFCINLARIKGLDPSQIKRKVTLEL